MTGFNMYRAVLMFFLILSALPAKAQETIIDEWELPRTAREFVSKNFSEQKMVRIVRDDDHKKREYEIVLGNNVKIEFDELGYWKEVDGNNSEIPTQFIPKKIMDHISQNYPAQKVRKIEKNSSKYEVELMNGTDLEFNLKGKFLKVDD